MRTCVRMFVFEFPESATECRLCVPYAGGHQHTGRPVINASSSVEFCVRSNRPPESGGIRLYTDAAEYE